MRWSGLTIGSEPPTLPGAVVRTFDTPGFAGMTFYEVRAKSIINKAGGMFGHTINPYRGCTHACSYCLVGDTPVLLTSGRTKAISELEVGEEIIGTVRDGRYRRYVVTTVLDKWSTTKPAYRIALGDGTELVASGDHRFLTGRGWKHVTGAMSGPDQRPYLTTGNKLMGTGRFALPPKDSEEYRRGYLCGMIRGDVHRFRLALIDQEALDRTKQYLADLGIGTKELDWPSMPCTEWFKGFLAGIFDAEGSFSTGILRISNTDPQIINFTCRALDTLGFVYTVEDPNLPNGMRVVRLLGELGDKLRLFQTIDPAITRKRTVQGYAIKSKAPLNVVSIEPLGLELPLWDITTGTGDFIANGVVSHNCFARNTHTYLDLDAGHDFDTKIVVKVNAVELLQRELSASKWQGESIAMGTNVDCYQRAEGRYELMPGIISALSNAHNPFSILTKGTLIQRDLPLLLAAAERTRVSVAFSVGFLDQDLWRTVESGAPSPSRRLDTIRAFTSAGMQVATLMAPILPGLSDSTAQIDATVDALVAAGARSITPIPLHLRTGAREWYTLWLREHHPDLLPLYEKIYGERAYASKDYQRLVTARTRRALRRHGLLSKPDEITAARDPRGPAADNRAADAPLGGRP